MGRRENIAASKRIAVMNSTDFKSWYYYRKQAPNPPTDPYRAYMIDKSLRAPQEDRTPWSKHPFEADWGKVDSPGYPHYAPPTKQPPYKKPTVTPITKTTRPQEKPKRPVEDEIKEIGRQISSKYNAPQVGKYDLRKNQGPMVGSMAMARNRASGTVFDSKLTMGTGGSHAFTIATAAHEFGHLAHAGGQNKEALKKAGVNVEYKGGLGRSRSPSTLKARYGNEVAAWKIAQPFVDALPGKERAKANWHKRFALTTYSHTQTQMKEGNVLNIKFGRKVF
jgi:hypothetical protein